MRRQDQDRFVHQTPVAVLNHLFAGAGDLPAPFGECGADPTADVLECDGFPPCAGSR